jgi:hypothetical protein
LHVNTSAFERLNKMKTIHEKRLPFKTGSLFCHMVQPQTLQLKLFLYLRLKRHILSPLFLLVHPVIGNFHQSMAIIAVTGIKRIAD